MNQEQDLHRRQTLNNERNALRDFLLSHGYAVGKALIDEKLRSCTELIYNLDPSEPSYQYKLQQAIGEGRACRNWEMPYQERLEELNNLLGNPTEDEK